MSKLKDFFETNIRRRITSLMAASFLLILVGAVLVPRATIDIVQNYDRSSRQLSESHEHISQIASYTNEIIMRVRGYFAYLDTYEYDQIFATKGKLDQSLADFKNTPMTSEERDLVVRVEEFFDNYLYIVLPEGASYVENGDYDALRKLITLGENNPVNDIILYAHQSEKLVNTKLKAVKDELIRNLILQGVFFICYLVIVIVLSIWLTRRLGKDIGHPLSALSKYALSYTRGGAIHPDILARKDEIGYLSRSLNNMIYEIQEKEEELLAQNEELQSQQDELQMQQDELTSALGQMEANEIYLNKRNLLTQSLANSTLEKRELLNSMIRNMVEITGSDKGILVLMNEAHDHAVHGISLEETAQFMNGFGDSALLRSLYSKQLFLRERDATDGERGYISERMLAYDIFVPLYKGDGDIIACMVLTRVGRAINSRDEVEFTSLAGQISLSLEKMEMHEAAEEQRQITQDMMNTLQEGVQLLSLNGKSVHVNEKLYELIGLSYEKSDLNGVLLEDFFNILAPRVEDAGTLFEFIRHALNGVTEQVKSMVYVLHNTKPRHIQIYWEPIYHNKQIFGIMLVHRDITKEHEVDRMKSEFVSTVSHELRTPLASILGFSELLLHREYKPERHQKYITTIHEEAKRLTQLINDFLDLQRMENGIQYYELKPVDLFQLVDEVKDAQQAGAANHRIIWSMSQERITVLGDRDKLYQVLLNLVNNAIKYSPSGGDIHISSHLDGDGVWINIADQGLGIPEQALPNLFTKFYRVDNSDRREIGGTGLGLAIVKEIVNQHHGEVSVNSQLGVGSTFSIYLPIHKSMIEQTNNRKLSDSMNEERALEVFIIENDHNMSVMLQDELGDYGYLTTTYSDGQRALSAMELHQPDIIVLDLRLTPEMSGWEVIERMKASQSLHNIPIVISSAFEEKEKAMQWGITHFLVKPYETNKLIEIIEEVLRQSHPTLPNPEPPED